MIFNHEVMTYAQPENLMDFDPQMFGISPREATSLDPQQRMLLEVAYETLEDAGTIPPHTSHSLPPPLLSNLFVGMSFTDIEGTKTGVYVGIMNDDFKIVAQNSRSILNGYSNTGAPLQQKIFLLLITSPLCLGTSITLAANRLSYFLNVYGPSLSLDTACSSSLIAVHLACDSIRRGECGIP